MQLRVLRREITELICELVSALSRRGQLDGVGPVRVQGMESPSEVLQVLHRNSLCAVQDHVVDGTRGGQSVAARS